MAKTVTLAAMIEQTRQAADMVGSAFVTDAEITSLINAYVAELYDLLVSAYGPAFYADSYTFNTVAGTARYALPTGANDGADFYQLLGVDADLGNGEPVSLTPFDFHSRNRYASPAGWHAGRPIHYRLHGSEIWLTPEPDAAYPITVHYIPAAPTLSTGGPVSSFDGINGWERYVVVSAAIALLQKEESDPSVLMAEKGSLAARIEALSKNRDAAYPDQIVRVRRRRWA